MLHSQVVVGRIHDIVVYYYNQGLNGERFRKNIQVGIHVQPLGYHSVVNLHKKLHDVHQDVVA
jgi:hypothetical protein